MKTILISAYSVNPFKGSEDGMGWNFTLQAAKYNKVIVVTRKNNREAIFSYSKENNVDLTNVQFEFYDLPYWMRFWKKKNKGALIYYYMWQIGLALKLKMSSLEFDVVHNLNFHNDWTPSFLWVLNKPLVWGPIGHHPEIKSSYLKTYGWKAQVLHKLKWVVKSFFWKFDPFLKLTRSKAKKIIVMNSAAKVGKGNKSKIVLMPSVATEEPQRIKNQRSDEFKVLSVGRLVPLKGFDIALKAFAKFYYSLSRYEQYHASFTIVGSGVLKAGLIHLIEKYKLKGRVRIIDWVERKDLLSYYRNSNVFLFPSHEGAGMVVAEAMSYGLPVVCLDNCGPGEFIDETCGIKVESVSYHSIIHNTAFALRYLHQNKEKREKLSRGAYVKFKKDLSWKLRAKKLANIYKSAMSA